MAICECCQQEMNGGDSCLWESSVIKRRTYPRLRYGQETRYGSGLPDYWEDYGDHCPDCAVSVGGLHHFGCDWEQCPHCGGQQIGCDCGLKRYLWANNPSQMSRSGGFCLVNAWLIL